MEFSISEFRRQQAAGLASISQTDTFSPTEDLITYAVASAQIDPVTFKRLPDQVLGVRHADLVASRTQLRSQLEELDLFIAEVEALAPEGKHPRDITASAGQTSLTREA